MEADDNIDRLFDDIRGSIINISSARGFSAHPGDLVYGGIKAALNRACQSVALDVAPYGIRVAEKGDFPAVPGFSVESGESEWQEDRSGPGLAVAGGAVRRALRGAGAGPGAQDHSDRPG